MNQKPVPLFSGSPRAICPYCGKTSYSAAGMHPQCAVRSADQEWTKCMKARREALVSVPAQTIKIYQRRCPLCQTVQHVRARTCGCGHVFPVKVRANSGE